jgi:hypothetical protein
MGIAYVVPILVSHNKHGFFIPLPRLYRALPLTVTLEALIKSAIRNEALKTGIICWGAKS